MAGAHGESSDIFGFTVPSALPPLDLQETVLLRALGRLELLTNQQIHAIAFPGLSATGVYRRLVRLLRDDLIWSMPTRLIGVNEAVQARKVRRQGTHVFGLGDAGKALLETLEVEHEPLTVGRLRSRDPRGRRPDTRTLSHDLQVSWWCTNLLLSAARNRYCRGVYVQTEFISHPRQRIDALSILRLSPDHPRMPGEVGTIPFFDGRPARPGEVDIRLALEVDKGSEELDVLLKKHESYRDLHTQGVYTAMLGGPLLAIYIVQSARRAGQIAGEFQAIWPSGWGVVTTPLGANDQQDGVLWGDYRALATGQPFPLLTQIVVAATGQVHCLPLLAREQWRAGVVIPAKPALTPEQIAGQKGGRASQARRQAQRAQGAPPAKRKR